MTRIRTLKISKNNYNDYVFNIHLNKKNLIGKLLNEVNTTDKKFVVSSTWNSLSKDLFKSMICNQYDYNEEEDTIELVRPKTILLVNSNGLSYFNPNNIESSLIGEETFNIELDKNVIDNKDKYEITELEEIKKQRNIIFDKIVEKCNLQYTETHILKEKKEQFLLDLNECIVNEYCCDIWIYTPSIKTGISFNHEYFDKQYSFGLCGSVCVREYIQMLFRARKLTEKCIEMCLGGKFKNWILPNKSENVYRLMKNNLGLFHKLQEKENSIFNIKDINVEDNEYLQFRSVNKTEYYNSTILFNQMFMIFMINNHGFKLNENIVFIDNQDDKYESESETFNNSNQSRKDKELDLFVKCDIFNNFTYKMYEEILERKNEMKPLSNKTYLQYRKYNEMNIYKHYLPILMYYWKNEDLKSVIEELEELIEDKQNTEEQLNLYKLLTSEEVKYCLEEYENTIHENINKHSHLEEYRKSVYNSKYLTIKRLLKYQQDIESNEYDCDYNKNTELEIDIRIIDTILKFLKIDNLDSEYTYINESSKKSKWTGIRNEIFSVENTITIEDTEYNFIDYLEDFLIPKVSSEILDKIEIEKTGTRLDITQKKDYNSILRILRHYLNKINIEIVFSTTNHFYKTTLLTFKQDKSKSYVMCDTDNYNLKPVVIEEQKQYENIILYPHDQEEDIIKYEDKCKIIYTSKIEEIEVKKRYTTIKYKYDGQFYNKEEYNKYETDKWNVKINFHKDKCIGLGIFGDYQKEKSYRYVLNKNKENKKTTLLRTSKCINKDTNEMDLEETLINSKISLQETQHNIKEIVKKYIPIISLNRYKTIIKELDSINTRYNIVSGEIDFDMIDNSIEEEIEFEMD
jgi:hypothetical protein